MSPQVQALGTSTTLARWVQTSIGATENLNSSYWKYGMCNSVSILVQCCFVLNTFLGRASMLRSSSRTTSQLRRRTLWRTGVKNPRSTSSRRWHIRFLFSSSNLQAFWSDHCSQVTCPVLLFSGENDWMAQPWGVAAIAASLPGLVDSIKVVRDNQRHFCQFWLGRWWEMEPPRLYLGSRSSNCAFSANIRSRL